MDKKEIIFPNGHKAQAVSPTAGTPATDILKALDLEPPKALILNIGGAADLDEALVPRLLQLYSRGIARVAADAGAIIMDGGTQAGVMSVMGQAVAERGRKSPLLGVAPAGRVAYPGDGEESSLAGRVPLDPNHSHFVLVDSQEWGGETATFYELADLLGKDIKVITILVDGGPVTKKELLASVRRGWPIIVIEGTGRLADEIAQLKKNKTASANDPEVMEILADGDIHFFALNDTLEHWERLLLQKLHANPNLKLAWERFALYDENAQRQQKNFKRLQMSLLMLGVAATLLVVIQAQLVQLDLIQEFVQGHPNLMKFKTAFQKFLHYPILVVPIIISVVVAALNRFKMGNKWILLRASAEALKGKVFRYRGGAPISSEQEETSKSREAQLAGQIEDISRRLMRTEVNLAGLRQYVGPIPPKMYGAAENDDGFSSLTPERYLRIRLGDQLNYYQLKTVTLEKQLRKLSWLIYIFGGIGTLLAAVGLELWVAITTTLVGTCTTFLEYQQVENSLMKYNQAATDLANLNAWWTALAAAEKANPANISRMVEFTETVLQSELSGWVQSMENTLADLKAKQEPETQTNKEPKGQ